MPEDPKTYPLRLPEELREKMDLLAAMHRRSLHSEILFILEEYASQDMTPEKWRGSQKESK